ncbi:hypothetical protein Tco_0149657 [Tanacetum coccineum]
MTKVVTSEGWWRSAGHASGGGCDDVDADGVGGFGREFLWRWCDAVVYSLFRGGWPDSGDGAEIRWVVTGKREEVRWK